LKHSSVVYKQNELLSGSICGLLKVGHWDHCTVETGAVIKMDYYTFLSIIGKQVRISSIPDFAWTGMDLV
jgi:hypothetical protein